MNYFPFFRGKQYEMVCIRENADLIAAEGFVPIIEPVKEQAGALSRALNALGEAGAKFLVVANPAVGKHVHSLSGDIKKAVDDCLQKHAHGAWLFQVKTKQDLVSLSAWLPANQSPSIFHAGYTDGKEIRSLLDGAGVTAEMHVFASNCPKSYRNEFSSGHRVMIADGFARQNNADYPDEEFFSNLNITYEEMGLTGFGDYLTVGSEYSESGGPAYAVAIHITYLDPDNDNGIYVKHFISDERVTQTDPAGKFREALAHLADECVLTDSKIKRTTAIDEFLKLRKTGHFPGLGYVKKLSMQHHLELLAG
jgi:hypothetical protein